MSNKFLRILMVIAIVLLLTPFNSGDASAKGLDWAIPTLSVRAFLQDQQSGKMIEIPVAMTSQENVITYSLVAPLSTCIGCSDTHSKTDSAYTVQMTVKQVYDEVPCSYYRCTRLLYSQGYLKRLDSQVRFSNAWIKNACYGHFDKAKGFCYTINTLNIGTPTTSKWYTDTVNWGSTPVETSGSAYVASRMHVDITRGTKKWSLEVCVAQSGQSLGDCFVG